MPRRQIVSFESFDIGDGDGGLCRAVLALDDTGQLWQFDQQWEPVPPLPVKPGFFSRLIKRVISWRLDQCRMR
jgi:hypothetical protein